MRLNRKAYPVHRIYCHQALDVAANTAFTFRQVRVMPTLYDHI